MPFPYTGDVVKSTISSWSRINFANDTICAPVLAMTIDCRRQASEQRRGSCRHIVAFPHAQNDEGHRFDFDFLTRAVTDQIVTMQQRMSELVDECFEGLGWCDVSRHRDLLLRGAWSRPNIASRPPLPLDARHLA
jgi:hypothetical protein